MNEAHFRTLWSAFYERVDAHKEELNGLDAAIGDADHGTNMARGLAKATEALAGTPTGSLRAEAKVVGMAIMSTVGGASGALWGSALLRFSAALPETPECSWEEFLAALEALVGAMRERGKAELGDKTMMDVFYPALDALKEATDPPAEAAARIARDATGWAAGTIDLVARKGRASYLGERSKGHQDPGATSTVMFLEALAVAMA
jgi:dihydroxyacetone kinase-like protein